MTIRSDQLSVWTKKLQSTCQSQTCTKKRSQVTAWWFSVGMIHYSFLNPGKTITSEKYAQQIYEMHQKLQCLQLALVNSKGPILPHDNTQLHIAHPTLRKFDKLGYKVLPHLSYSAELLPTNYHLFKHLNNFFVGKTLPQSAGCRKCFLRVC